VAQVALNFVAAEGRDLPLQDRTQVASRVAPGQDEGRVLVEAAAAFGGCRAGASATAVACACSSHGVVDEPYLVLRAWQRNR
jgi:hypothetical protein